MSEQQINPKVLSVASSAIIRKIPKMVKIVYRQMPAPRELSQHIPAPGQKLGCKSPRVGANFGANPRECAGGGVVMDEIDTCISPEKMDGNTKVILIDRNIKLFEKVRKFTFSNQMDT